jgi:hypothetical protein
MPKLQRQKVNSIRDSIPALTNYVKLLQVMVKKWPDSDLNCALMYMSKALEHSISYIEKNEKGIVQ